MIIFGLGNPGLGYRSTRHNAGYIFVEQLARKYRKRFVTLRGYKMARLRLGRQAVKLIKPISWMNLTGQPVGRILEMIDEEFIVVLDDLNLPLGSIRLRAKGSDGGHLGLRSIIEHLSKSDFPRLRIGIGPVQGNAADYVLAPFSRSEKKILLAVIDKGIEGIEIMMRNGLVKAQNLINSTNFSDCN
jgi:PTH1 family peptidyl-tRNA hydrolase